VQHPRSLRSRTTATPSKKNTPKETERKRYSTKIYLLRIKEQEQEGEGEILRVVEDMSHFADL
jgi:hypothetical protein